VLIINDSYELTFRDYKKAKNLSQEIDTQFLFCSEHFGDLVQNNTIIYCTFEAFLESLTNKGIDISKGSTIIVDEFDSILFENRYS
jgi:hypothetical protein